MKNLLPLLAYKQHAVSYLPHRQRSLFRPAPLPPPNSNFEGLVLVGQILLQRLRLLVAQAQWAQMGVHGDASNGVQVELPGEGLGEEVGEGVLSKPQAASSQYLRQVPSRWGVLGLQGLLFRLCLLFLLVLALSLEHDWQL